jgi:hypothetical protein
MIKPVIHRRHLDALSTLLLEEFLDHGRHDMPDEQRLRVIAMMTLAFYLHVEGRPITVAAIIDKTRFKVRVVGLAFKYLADHDYLVAEQVVNRQGRGRAFQYSFAPKFVRRVIERHERGPGAAASAGRR